MCQQQHQLGKTARWEKLTEEARNGRKRRRVSSFREGAAIVGCFIKTTTNGNMELQAWTVRIQREGRGSRRRERGGDSSAGSITYLGIHIVTFFRDDVIYRNKQT